MTDPTPATAQRTPPIDSDHHDLAAFATRHATGADDCTLAAALSRGVRDGSRGDRCRIDLPPAGRRARGVLASGYGRCVPEAALPAPACPAAGVPARVGGAGVQREAR